AERQAVHPRGDVGGEGLGVRGGDRGHDGRRNANDVPGERAPRGPRDRENRNAVAKLRAKTRDSVWQLRLNSSNVITGSPDLGRAAARRGDDSMWSRGWRWQRPSGPNRRGWAHGS